MAMAGQAGNILPPARGFQFREASAFVPCCGTSVDRSMDRSARLAGMTGCPSASASPFFIKHSQEKFDRMSEQQTAPPVISSHRFLDEAGDTTFYGKGKVMMLGQPGVSLASRWAW